jgi:hypothetical protein
LRAIRHAPLSHQLWPTTSTSVQRRFSPLCRAEFRGILLDILGVSSRPAVVRISVSATPKVHRCWRCVDHDRDRRADRRLRRSWHPAMRLFIDPAAASAVRCSAVRRGAAAPAWLTRTQRASTSATTGCGSAGRPRTPVPGRLLPRGDPDLGRYRSADPNINRRSGGSASLQIP